MEEREKVTQEGLEIRLREYFESFFQIVSAIAESVRGDEVVPFCDRYALTFKAGMGVWQIFNADGISIREGSAYPGFLRLEEILDTPVPGLEQDIGSLMSDYVPGELGV